MGHPGSPLSSSRTRSISLLAGDLGATSLAACVEPFCVLLRAPSVLYLVTLAIFLFRPPDLELHHLDRIAFLLLLSLVLLRVFLLREKLRWSWSISFPMLLLLLLALYSPFTETFNAQTWSLLAAKFLVPFTMFHLSQVVFADRRSFEQLELFCLIALTYLAVISVATLLGATSIIYPRYILDEGLGIHADRARGPFLQAVANGMSLNLLGLLALDSWRRERLRGPFALILAVVPVAILATMTRAVWLSFLLSILGMLMFSRAARIRRACAGLVLTGAVGTLFALSMSGCRLALQDRLEERSPVEFRASIYEVSWDMAWEKPWLGWGQNRMPAEIAKRMSDYRPDTYCAHSSYLEILIEQGFLGFTCYAWMLVGLIRLGVNSRRNLLNSYPVDEDFRRLWIIILCVYLLNAAFVVVNYQFVNALVFTLAGILAAHQTTSSLAVES